MKPIFFSKAVCVGASSGRRRSRPLSDKAIDTTRLTGPPNLRKVLEDNLVVCYFGIGTTCSRSGAEAVRWKACKPKSGSIAKEVPCDA